MSALAALAAAQAGLMALDEWAFHRARGLGRWEGWGHPADSVAFALALAPAAWLAPTPRALALFAAAAAASCLLITKDEWIHARECGGGEQWLHSVLFVLHPCVLAAAALAWARGEAPLLRAVLPLAALAWGAYQWVYWVGGGRCRAPGPLVDNDFYDALGERWHEGDRHAIALLRAETPVRLEYVRAALDREGVAPGARVLDVGCGGGFLANPLAAAGYRVTGVDRSAASLEAARARVPAGAEARYETGDALALGEPEASYDAVLLMDILEHLEAPGLAIAEAARVLRPGGLLFFHTFNRTPLAWLLAVKGIGFVSSEGPDNVHAWELFLTPGEVQAAGRAVGLEPADLRGIRPVPDAAFLRSLLSRRVDRDFRFELTSSTAVGYLGYFRR